MKTGKRRGFTLVEIIVVVAVLVLLAAIVIPSVGSVGTDAKAAKILSIVDSLKKAVTMHYTDTGRLAIEYSGSNYASSDYHQLSLSQSYSGWNGPYIDHPLTTGDNPFGGFVLLYSDLTGGSAKPNGFDLTGSGTASATGSGQFVAFSNVPESVAETIDDALDNGIPGDWETTGRVEYSSDNNGTVMIFLMDV